MADAQTRLQANLPHLVFELILHAANCHFKQTHSNKSRLSRLFTLLCRLNINYFSIQPPGHKKCREVWPSEPFHYEKTFNIFLDMILLVIPLVVLGAAYSMISRTLWQSMDNEKQLVRETLSMLHSFTFVAKIDSSALIYPFLTTSCHQNKNNPPGFSNGDNLTAESSSRKRRKPPETVSFQKLRNSSQEMMLLNRDTSKKHTFGLRR